MWVVTQRRLFFPPRKIDYAVRIWRSEASLDNPLIHRVVRVEDHWRVREVGTWDSSSGVCLRHARDRTAKQTNVFLDQWFFRDRVRPCSSSNQENLFCMFCGRRMFLLPIERRQC